MIITEPTCTAEQAIYQLATCIKALAEVCAQHSEGDTMAYLGAAVLASRQSGMGDNFAGEIYEKVFPGKPLPTVVSSEQFAAMVAAAQQPM